jgi:proteic killer suppression protein
MIENFRHRGLKRLYEQGDKSLIRPDMLTRVERILARLDEAKRIEDVDMHDFKLHPLKGDLRGFWSVTVRANWRIIFRFDDGRVFDVELIDYH